MVQEAPATPQEAFAPPAAEPATPQEAVQPAVTEAPPAAEPPVEGEPEQLTYEAWQAQLDASPELKVAHEERETERVEVQRKELRKEEYRKFQGAIQPAITEWAQNSGALRQGIDEIRSTIQQAVADGTLDARQAAQALGAHNPLAYFEGVYWLLGKLGEAVEDEPFANELLGRVNQMAKGKPDLDFATDILKRLTEPTIATGYVSKAKYDADIKKARADSRAATLNDIAAKGRGNPANNPDMTLKGTGGGGWHTKTEARALHVQNKITNDEMRRINRDPSIPD